MIQAVVGICEREGKMLIAERPFGKPYAGYWEFPGGKIEGSETPYEALKRELYEEIGIDIHFAIHLFDHPYTYPDKIVNLSVWHIKSFFGEAINKENQTLRWLSIKELKNFKLLEGNLSLIEKISVLWNTAAIK